MTLKDAMSQKIKALGFRMEAKASRYCPVDTGLMRSQMFSEHDEATNTLTVGNTAKYAKHIEYGTPALVLANREFDPEDPIMMWAAKMKRGAFDAQQMPFLRPAIYEELVQFKKEVKKPIKLRVKVGIK